MPKRIQRKRTKGWRMPPNSLYVGRPTKWGNPYSMKTGYTRQESVDLFRDYIYHEIGVYPDGILKIKEELAKYDYLACWCPLDQPCHVDVYLEMLDNFVRQW